MSSGGESTASSTGANAVAASLVAKALAQLEMDSREAAKATSGYAGASSLSSSASKLSLPASSGSKLPSYPLASGNLAGAAFGAALSPGGVYSSAAKTLAASMQRQEREAAQAGGNKPSTPLSSSSTRHLFSPKSGAHNGPAPLISAGAVDASTSEVVSAASEAAAAASAYLRGLNQDRSLSPSSANRQDDSSHNNNNNNSKSSAGDDADTSAYLHDIAVHELKRKHAMELDASRHRWDDERRALLHAHAGDLQRLQTTISSLEAQLADQSANSRASLVAAEVKLQSREEAHSAALKRQADDFRATIATLEARHAEAISTAASKLAEAEAFTVTAVADCEREWEGRLKAEVEKVQASFSAQWSEREAGYKRAWEEREAQYAEQAAKAASELEASRSQVAALAKAVEESEAALAKLRGKVAKMTTIAAGGAAQLLGVEGSDNGEGESRAKRASRASKAALAVAAAVVHMSSPASEKRMSLAAQALGATSSASTSSAGSTAAAQAPQPASSLAPSEKQQVLASQQQAPKPQKLRRATGAMRGGAGLFLVKNTKKPAAASLAPVVEENNNTADADGDADGNGERRKSVNFSGKASFATTSSKHKLRRDTGAAWSGNKLLVSASSASSAAAALASKLAAGGDDDDEEDEEDAVPMGRTSSGRAYRKQPPLTIMEAASEEEEDDDDEGDKAPAPAASASQLAKPEVKKEKKLRFGADVADDDDEKEEKQKQQPKKASLRRPTGIRPLVAPAASGNNKAAMRRLSRFAEEDEEEEDDDDDDSEEDEDEDEDGDDVGELPALSSAAASRARPTAQRYQPQLPAFARRSSIQLARQALQKSAALSLSLGGLGPKEAKPVKPATKAAGVSFADPAPTAAEVKAESASAAAAQPQQAAKPTKLRRATGAPFGRSATAGPGSNGSGLAPAVLVLNPGAAKKADRGLRRLSRVLEAPAAIDEDEENEDGEKTASPHLTASPRQNSSAASRPKLRRDTGQVSRGGNSALPAHINAKSRAAPSFVPPAIREEDEDDESETDEDDDDDDEEQEQPATMAEAAAALFLPAGRPGGTLLAAFAEEDEDEDEDDEEDDEEEEEDEDDNDDEEGNDAEDKDEEEEEDDEDEGEDDEAPAPLPPSKPLQPAKLRRPTGAPFGRNAQAPAAIPVAAATASAPKAAAKPLRRPTGAPFGRNAASNAVPAPVAVATKAVKTLRRATGHPGSHAVALLMSNKTRSLLAEGGKAHMQAASAVLSAVMEDEEDESDEEEEHAAATAAQRRMSRRASTRKSVTIAADASDAGAGSNNAVSRTPSGKAPPPPPMRLLSSNSKNGLPIASAPVPAPSPPRDEKEDKKLTEGSDDDEEEGEDRFDGDDEDDDDDASSTSSLGVGAALSNTVGDMVKAYETEVELAASLAGEVERLAALSQSLLADNASLTQRLAAEEQAVAELESKSFGLEEELNDTKTRADEQARKAEREVTEAKKEVLRARKELAASIAALVASEVMRPRATPAAVATARADVPPSASAGDVATKGASQAAAASALQSHHDAARAALEAAATHLDALQSLAEGAGPVHTADGASRALSKTLEVPAASASAASSLTSVYSQLAASTKRLYDTFAAHHDALVAGSSQSLADAGAVPTGEEPDEVLARLMEKVSAMAANAEQQKARSVSLPAAVPAIFLPSSLTANQDGGSSGAAAELSPVERVERELLALRIRPSLATISSVSSSNTHLQQLSLAATVKVLAGAVSASVASQAEDASASGSFGAGKALLSSLGLDTDGLTVEHSINDGAASSVAVVLPPLLHTLPVALPLVSGAGQSKVDLSSSLALPSISNLATQSTQPTSAGGSSSASNGLPALPAPTQESSALLAAFAENSMVSLWRSRYTGLLALLSRGLGDKAFVDAHSTSSTAGPSSSLMEPEIAAESLLAYLSAIAEALGISQEAEPIFELFRKGLYSSAVTVPTAVAAGNSEQQPAPSSSALLLSPKARDIIAHPSRNGDVITGLQDGLSKALLSLASTERKYSAVLSALTLTRETASSLAVRAAAAEEAAAKWAGSIASFRDAAVRDAEQIARLRVHLHSAVSYASLLKQAAEQAVEQHAHERTAWVNSAKDLTATVLSLKPALSAAITRLQQEHENALEEEKSRSAAALRNLQQESQSKALQAREASEAAAAAARDFEAALTQQLKEAREQSSANHAQSEERGRQIQRLTEDLSSVQRELSDSKEAKAKTAMELGRLQGELAAVTAAKEAESSRLSQALRELERLRSDLMGVATAKASIEATAKETARRAEHAEMAKEEAEAQNRLIAQLAQQATETATAAAGAAAAAAAAAAASAASSPVKSSGGNSNNNGSGSPVRMVVPYPPFSGHSTTSAGSLTNTAAPPSPVSGLMPSIPIAFAAGTVSPGASFSLAASRSSSRAAMSSAADGATGNTGATADSSPTPTSPTPRPASARSQSTSGRVDSARHQQQQQLFKEEEEKRIAASYASLEADYLKARSRAETALLGGGGQRSVSQTHYSPRQPVTSPPAIGSYMALQRGDARGALAAILPAPSSPSSTSAPGGFPSTVSTTAAPTSPLTASALLAASRASSSAAASFASSPAGSGLRGAAPGSAAAQFRFTPGYRWTQQQGK